MKISAAAFLALLVSKSAAFTAPSLSVQYGASALSAATLDVAEESAAKVAATSDVKEQMVSGEAVIMKGGVEEGMNTDLEWQVKAAAEKKDDSITP
eukprot:15338807-Ditylum_brightwellii.AAC.1